VKTDELKVEAIEGTAEVEVSAKSYRQDESLFLELRCKDRGLLVRGETENLPTLRMRARLARRRAADALFKETCGQRRRKLGLLERTSVADSYHSAFGEVGGRFMD
jgi:hypothetical protein